MWCIIIFVREWKKLGISFVIVIFLRIAIFKYVRFLFQYLLSASIYENKGGVRNFVFNEKIKKTIFLKIYGGYFRFFL